MKYEDQEFEQMPGWVRLGEDVPELRDAPFKLWFRAFKSSSREAEAFLHDPRRSMRGEPVEGFEDAETSAIEGVGPEARVGTFVVNHHRTLSRRIIYTMATVADDDDVVGLTVYKLEA